MLRQTEWGVQDRPITKKGVMPVTALFFRKCCFSLRALMYQPPKCRYSYFSNALEFYLMVFFPCGYP